MIQLNQDIYLHYQVTSRANVWCSRCGENGHYASECYQEPQRRVHYIDSGDEVYYAISEDRIEAEENSVFRVQPTYRRGRGATQIPAAAPDSHPHRPGTNQGMVP